MSHVWRVDRAVTTGGWERWYGRRPAGARDAAAYGRIRRMKDYLHHYLRRGSSALVGKLDGLSDYDVRRPLTPTGTNLLGLVKHTGLMEAGYFGEVFGRPLDDVPAGLEEDAEPNTDMWASADESREHILDFHRRACAHADETIAALSLDDTGLVRWWQEGNNKPTLQRVLVHMIAETNRHAGHADIVREQIDGVVGMLAPGTNLPEGDAAWWQAYHDKVQRAADTFRQG